MPAHRNADTAVVVPAYREATVIGGVVDELRASFDNVIIVDDGSPDSSGNVAARHGAHVLYHPINLGQGAALQTGFAAALRHPDVKFIVTFDADGQHKVADALSMVDMLRQGNHDVIFGSRFLDERTELTSAKRLVLRLAARYTNAVTGLTLTDAHNGLRAFTREVGESIDLVHDGMAHASEIVTQISKGKWRYAEAPVHIVYTDYSRAKGQSLWNAVNILFDLVVR